MGHLGKAGIWTTHLLAGWKVGFCPEARRLPVSLHHQQSQQCSGGQPHTIEQVGVGLGGQAVEVEDTQ